jgi:hypothetical protein
LSSSGDGNITDPNRIQDKLKRLSREKKKQSDSPQTQAHPKASMMTSSEKK